ncbi:sperm-associated antigen 1A isoform X2 [Nerophis ophidion]|uniref:sperm-associated antigen 1A isoform X2 n=1 Tax=Nerophis ophidion TaxID=159077 RepID=UPI002ADF6BCE|nr:sperm-associated antigen 1A isoform X2 [Nerophis ophidion]
MRAINSSSTASLVMRWTSTARQLRVVLKQWRRLAGISSPQDLCILYSNRAACYLKEGNSTDCIQDCTKALNLQPYSLKPLLRRAMAYELLERYRNAYVDYKTVLQIDTGVQAAHDSVHRITRMLIEQDGMVWREKLPEIPVVPLSVQQEHWEKPVSMEQARARAARVAQDEVRRKEARVSLLKQEGNDLIKRGHFHDAMHKYTECIAIKPDDCALYTNRAISLLKLSRFQEAKQDCDAALLLEPTNKKAFYRRALAHKGLQDYLSASSDLQEVLELDPNVREAEAELLVVTGLLRQSLMDDRFSKKLVCLPKCVQIQFSDLFFCHVCSASSNVMDLHPGDPPPFHAEGGDRLRNHKV